MSNESKRIVDKAWNFATVLWHDGVPFLAYTEEITFLLFLKMADELTRPPYNRPAIVPAEFGWSSLLAKEGDALKRHYDRVLQELARKPGMLGDIFKRAKSAIEKPETLRRVGGAGVLAGPGKPGPARTPAPPLQSTRTDH